MLFALQPSWLCGEDDAKGALSGGNRHGAFVTSSLMIWYGNVRYKFQSATDQEFDMNGTTFV